MAFFSPKDWPLVAGGEASLRAPPPERMLPCPRRLKVCSWLSTGHHERACIAVFVSRYRGSNRIFFDPILLLSGSSPQVGRRVVATGGARLSSAERNPWKTSLSINAAPAGAQGFLAAKRSATHLGPIPLPLRGRVFVGRSYHGLRSGSLRIACAPPVATFQGPIRGQKRYRKSEIARTCNSKNGFIPGGGGLWPSPAATFDLSFRLKSGWKPDPLQGRLEAAPPGENRRVGEQGSRGSGEIKSDA